MSDTGTTTTDAPETPEGLRAAKAAADQANATMKAENLVLRKQIMFSRAGIEFDKGVGELLFNQWDAETGTLEQLIEKASEYGILKGTSDDEPNPADQQQQQQQQMGDMFRGGPAGGGPAASLGDGPNPNEIALQTFRQAQRDDQPVSVAQTMALGKIFEAHAKGDKRVMFDKSQHAADARAYEGR